MERYTVFVSRIDLSSGQPPEQLPVVQMKKFWRFEKAFEHLFNIEHMYFDREAAEKVGHTSMIGAAYLRNKKGDYLAGKRLYTGFSNIGIKDGVYLQLHLQHSEYVRYENTVTKPFKKLIPVGPQGNLYLLESLAAIRERAAQFQVARTDRKKGSRMDPGEHGREKGLGI